MARSKGAVRSASIRPSRSPSLPRAAARSRQMPLQARELSVKARESIEVSAEIPDDLAQVVRIFPR